MARKIVDCRDMPSENNCTLTIAGEEDEVVRAAALHAVDYHGEKDTPELRNMIRQGLKDDTATYVPPRAGTGEQPTIQH